jgi:hypothetical protein
MSKANKELKTELGTLAASAQKKEVDHDMGRYIPAKFSNIGEKLENIIDWFDVNGIKKSDTVPMKDSLNSSEILLNKSETRCIVITVCLNSNLLDFGTTDSVTYL